MDEYIQTLKEYYESKRKRKSLPVEIEKKPYYYDKDYLTFLENRLLEEKSIILIIKYNIVYNLGLDDNLEECEQIEENIKKIKEERDKIKFTIERKEERKLKEIKKIYDAIELLKSNYHQIPDTEEKKIIYSEIELKRSEINDILNDDRCILKDSNTFTLVHDYQPIYGNEILMDDSQSEESESKESESKSKNLGQLQFNDLQEDLHELRSASKKGPKLDSKSEPKISKPKLKFDSKYEPDEVYGVEESKESKPETKPSKPKLKFNSNP
jgi:hypothetical protein